MIKIIVMACRKTVQLGHPALKAKNILITKFNSKKVKLIIQDLIDTMKKNELVGISGPQIALNYQIFVTEPRVTPSRTIDQADELRVFINPKIINLSKKKSIIYEGCGSVSNGKLFGPVERPKEVTIEASDQNGKEFQLKCDGLLSRVIQHEYDHLNGIEFTEKIYDNKKLLDKEFYIRNIKLSRLQINNSKITLKEVKYL